MNASRMPVVLLGELLAANRAEQALLQQSSTLRAFRRDFDQTERHLQPLQQPLESPLLDSTSIEPLSAEPLEDEQAQQLVTKTPSETSAAESQQPLRPPAADREHPQEAETEAAKVSANPVRKKPGKSSHGKLPDSTSEESQSATKHNLKPAKQRRADSTKQQPGEQGRPSNPLLRARVEKILPHKPAGHSTQVHAVGSSATQPKQDKSETLRQIPTSDSSASQPPEIDRERARQCLQQRISSRAASAAWNQPVTVEAQAPADTDTVVKNRPDKQPTRLEQQLEKRLGKLLPSSKPWTSESAVQSTRPTFSALETKTALMQQKLDYPSATPTDIETSGSPEAASQASPVTTGQRLTGLRGLATLADETPTARLAVSREDRPMLALPEEAADASLETRDSGANIQASTASALAELLAAEARRAGIDLDEVGP